MLNKMKAVMFGVVASLAAVSQSSFAAISAADVAPIQTDLSTTVSNVTPAVIAILAIVMGVTIGVKLVKRLIGSGT